MRALKLILAGLFAVLAVTAGFVVAAVAALAGLTIFLVSRLLGHSRIRVAGPQFRSRSSPPKPTDAIEVTATEVEQTTALPSPPPQHSPEHDRLRA